MKVGRRQEKIQMGKLELDMDNRINFDILLISVLNINPCLPHFSGVTRLPHMGPKDPGEKNCYKK